MKQKLWVAVSVFGLGLLIGFVTSSSHADEPVAPEAQVAPLTGPTIPFYVRDARGRLVPNPALVEALRESLIEEEEIAARDAATQHGGEEEEEEEEEESDTPAPAPNRPTPLPAGHTRLEPLAPLPERRERTRQERVRPRTQSGAGVTVTF